MSYRTIVSLASFIIALSTFTASAAADDSADASLERLQRQFQTLQRSLVSKGGIAPEDAPVIERLRSRFAAFNASHPANRAGIASELQLSAWLDDHEQVNTLYERLVLLDPEEMSIGLAWASYFARLDEQQRVDHIYDELLRISPDSAHIRTTRARRLKQANQFHRALEVLSELNEEDVDADVLLLKSECLFAEHRFEESVAVLRDMPEEMTQRPRIRQQVEQLLPTREQYIEYWNQEQQRRSAEAAADDLPRVEIVTERGTIVLELFENEAPNTVANFITLAEDGFYDESTFHRVMPNFMAQGGDPNTKPGGEGVPGSGGPGYRFADEFDREDARKHFSGTLSMANSGPNTNGSQFFLTHQPTNHLNGRHTVFGRVVEGLDVVRSLKVDDVMQSVRVLRKRDHAYEVVKLDEPAIATERPRIPDDLDPDLQRQIRELLEQEDVAGPAQQPE